MIEADLSGVEVATDDLVRLALLDRGPTTATELGDALELGATTVDRVRLLGVLDDLRDEGVLAATERARVDGGTETVYELTGDGRRRASELRERLRERRVVVTDAEGTEERLPLGNVGDVLDTEDPLVTALARVTEEGRVPLDRYVSEGEAFVDREEPLAAVREAVEDSITGPGRPVLVAGEPGMGKTALVEAALDGIDD